MAEDMRPNCIQFCAKRVCLFDNMPLENYPRTNPSAVTQFPQIQPLRRAYFEQAAICLRVRPGNFATIVSRLEGAGEVWSEVSRRVMTSKFPGSRLSKGLPGDLNYGSSSGALLSAGAK